MSFYQSKQENGTDDAAMLFRCLLEGRYAEASLLMPVLENTAAPDVLFNMALVCRRLENEQRAVSFLERALVALRRLSAEGRRSSPVTYTRLRAAEIENAVFAPMSAEYVRAFPAQVKENILLTLIACYTSLDMPNKADALAVGLTDPIFTEFKTNLRENQKHGSV